MLVRQTTAALGVKAASLRLIDKQTSRLELVTAHGLSQSTWKRALSVDHRFEVLQGKAALSGSPNTTHPVPRRHARQRSTPSSRCR
jgi:hypothetical protein